MVHIGGGRERATLRPALGSTRLATLLGQLVIRRSLICLIQARTDSQAEWSASHFCRYVCERRPVVHPNESFIVQLANYEVKLRRYSSVTRCTSEPFDFPQWRIIQRSLPEPPNSSVACCVS